MPKSPDSTRFTTLLDRRKSLVDKRLRALAGTQAPRSVYEPIQYVLASGGKRVRAILTLLACEACGGTPAQALPAATAIEVLHNFTLVHDDIMDNADLRRGRPTAHKKWNTAMAILSGDLMAAIAYRELLRSKSIRTKELSDVFTDAFAVVCEGQGFDMEFERRMNVAAADYLMMIGKKTARVVSASTELGALCANGSPAEVRALRNYGTRLGLAFQLRDDVLDIAGAEHETGKRIGTDILEGKRTYLLLTAAQRAKGKELQLVRAVLERKPLAPGAIPAMLDIYRRTGALDDANAAIVRETRNAQRSLRVMKPGVARDTLSWLADSLAGRVQ